MQEVVKSLHNVPGGGHLGLTKTWAKVQERFYWPSGEIKWKTGASNAAAVQQGSLLPRTPVHPWSLDEYET